MFKYYIQAPLLQIFIITQSIFQLVLNFAMLKKIDQDKKYIAKNFQMLMESVQTLQKIVKSSGQNSYLAEQARQQVQLQIQILLCSKKILDKNYAKFLNQKLSGFINSLKSIIMFFKQFDKASYSVVKGIVQKTPETSNPDIEAQKIKVLKEC